MAITKRQRARIEEVRQRVQREMSSHPGDMFARGMSSEGFAGGYMQAINDLELFLGSGVEPNTRTYWNHTPPPAKVLLRVVPTIECPHCHERISLEARADCDGFCPECNCEIELDEK